MPQVIDSLLPGVKIIGTRGRQTEGVPTDEHSPWLFVSRFGYTACYIRSDADQEGLLVKVGFENESKVYLNGREIFRHDESKLYVPDQYVVSGVELKAGLNVVVFKVVRETGTAS